MRSIKLTYVKKLELDNLEKPEKEEGKVMIKVTKTGICGSDIHNWDMGSPKGLVLGHEFCGTVIYNGGREDLKEGDRVTALPISPCNHCYACETGNVQYCPETWNHAVGLSLDNPGGLTEIINVRSDMVIKVPEEMTDEEVSMVEPTAVSFHATNLANIKVGESVLIVGGGIIGLGAAMFAKKEGASFVALSETNENRGKKAVDLQVADKYYKVSDKMYEEMRKDVPNGFDVVIECCGNSSAVTSALTSARNGGTVVLVGVSYNPITIPSIIPVMHELTVKGAIAYTKKEFETCAHLISKKQIDVSKFLSKILPLEETQKAYEELTSGNTDSIKIIIDPNK